MINILFCPRCCVLNYGTKRLITAANDDVESRNAGRRIRRLNDTKRNANADRTTTHRSRTVSQNESIGLCLSFLFIFYLLIYFFFLLSRFSYQFFFSFLFNPLYPFVQCEIFPLLHLPPARWRILDCRRGNGNVSFGRHGVSDDKTNAKNYKR